MPQAVGKLSLLGDNSWIKDVNDEDEDVDKGIEEVKTTITTSRSTSVQDLSKKFSGIQDELRSSTYSTLKTDPPSSTITTSKTTITQEPKTSTRTTSETTTSTSQSVSSTGIRSPTETFSERVMSSSKGPQYSSYSPTRTTKVTETSFSSSTDAGSTPNDTSIYSAMEDDYLPTDRNSITTTTKTRTSSMAEDDLYGTLLPRSITSVSDRTSSISSSSSSSSTVTKREIITVESSRGIESSMPSTMRSTSYSSYTEDLPSTRTTSYSISSTPSEDYSSDNRSYSYPRPDSSYEYSSSSSITSPTTYDSKSYRSNSRSDDNDSIYSSSTKSVYAAPERSVLQKDLCTSCHKPFTGEAKMVLDDMKINCHASCFKCEVCNSTLGHMKAGDSMWLYKRMVHCENCFEVTRDKWRR